MHFLFVLIYKFVRKDWWERKSDKRERVKGKSLKDIVHSCRVDKFNFFVFQADLVTSSMSAVNDISSVDASSSSSNVATTTEQDTAAVSTTTDVTVDVSQPLKTIK